jgi:hypothetical protein
MRDEKTSRTLVGKPEGKDHLEDLGSGWAVSIHMDLKEVEQGCMN